MSISEQKYQLKLAVLVASVVAIATGIAFQDSVSAQLTGTAGTVGQVGGAECTGNAATPAGPAAAGTGGGSAVDILT